ncbi:histidine biosynthesis protein [Methylomonas sp. LL1]|uniref:HisA/HisF-related TIM barrel protein n=1 Tax=Methylomonas sp. LL1 TaxID=2785785 RepID=UPI0018C36892|nr:HisA/HisF-related TIM barrel protein [Methylomonas sp. LL1]QPK64134.1 histidine biosynthesis protein [Methylomonas sp. LL1]
MRIIPVIDLKDGLVVHAVRGDRARYQPIHLHSGLSHRSDIDAVLTGFLTLYPFNRFYIADLNAITGSGNHRELIESLLYKYPDIDFWIDNGRQISDITQGPPNQKWVLGTESQTSPARRADQPFILSLDFKNQQAAGHPSWFEQADCWPDDIIVMTLSRVGGNQGPDLEKLAELYRRNPDKHFIAAGGVRHLDDLNHLKKVGIQSALVATALHSGAISADQIRNL